MVAVLVAAAGLWWYFGGGPKVNLAAKPGEVRWVTRVGESAANAKVVADTVLCNTRSRWLTALMGAPQPKLAAFDPASGRRLWTKKTALTGVIPVTAGPQVLVLNRVNTKSGLQALDPRTGRLKWELPWDQTHLQAAVMRDEHTFIGIGDKRVQAASRDATGVQWEWAVDGATTFALFLAGGNVFVARDLPTTREMAAVNAITGKEVWSSVVAEDPMRNRAEYVTEIAAGDGVVCALTSSGILRAFDTVTGKSLWDTGGTRWSSYNLAIASGRVFLGDGRKFRCLSLVDGKEIWATAFATMPGQPLFITASGNTLYCACFNAFVALDADAGAILWTLPIEGYVWGPPAVAGETVYFATGSGRLYAVAVESEGQGK